MVLIDLKVSFIIVVIISSILGCMVPLHLPKTKLSKFINHIGKSFAAGVFLGLSLLHLYPESCKILSDFLYPISGLISLISYLTMVFLEKVLFSNAPVSSDYTNNLENVFLVTNSEYLSIQNKIKGKAYYIKDNTQLIYPLIDTNEKKNCAKSFFITLLVLCFHSIIEGITLGLQSDSKAFIKLGIAVIIHKIPESLVVGIESKKNGAEIKWSIVLIFILATPSGFLIGMAMYSEIYLFSKEFL
jgi:zinc transporter ZupT